MQRALSTLIPIALAAGLAGLTNAQAAEDTSLATPAVQAGVDEILASPDRFAGQRVGIEDASVEAVLTPNASLLTIARVHGRRLMVAVPYLANTRPTAGLAVVVTGRAWLISKELVLVWPMLKPAWETLAPLEGQPLVVADSLRTQQGMELARPLPTVTTIPRIVASGNGAAIVDAPVHLTAVTVSAVTPPQSFEAHDKAGHGVLVEVAAASPRLPAVGDVVDIQGVVRMPSTVVYPLHLLPWKVPPRGNQRLYVVAGEVRPAR
jgi:hypothetical protein